MRTGPVPRWSRPWQTIVFEAEVTARMLADNALAGIVPPLVFNLGASLYYQLGWGSTVRNLLVTLVIAFVYEYVLDASNQSRGRVEDRINKPYRPVPRGMITSRDALVRFALATLVYLLLGWALDVLPWVLLWLATVTVLFVGKPHYYPCYKTPCMITGTVAQLCTAWQLAGPLNPTGLTWITVIAILFNLALIFEDVRDMAGDRAIGRRTPALVFGEWPVRIWFAMLELLIPIGLHFLLFAPTGATPWRITLCDVAISAVSSTAAARALLLRSRTADRITYQLFIFSYAVALAAGTLLWL